MKLTLKEAVLFALFGALMYASKIAMAVLPNIHLIGVFIVAFTVVYRKKALYPLYIFVFLDGLFSGFALWWIPYLYVWTFLWGGAMLIPKKLPKIAAAIVYPILCALHGFLFGTLCAPSQALFFGLDFNGMIVWIIQGLPFDAIHGVSNFLCGMLIYPIVMLLKTLEKRIKN